MKTIETERLILRDLSVDDINDFYNYSKNINVTSNINWAPHYNKDVASKFLESYINSNEVWAIVLKENKKVIGHLKIYPDENRGKFSERNSAKLLTYALTEDYWGKGYMTEVVKCVVKYAFDEMNIELLTVFHVPNNIRSKRVIEKSGFQYEITIENGYKCIDGQYCDSICYSLLKSDYYNK